MNYREIVRLSLILVLIASLTQCAQDETPQTVSILGPYLQNMSDEEVTICWASREGATGISEGDSIVQDVSEAQYYILL